jgi:hypothetical protein
MQAARVKIVIMRRFFAFCWLCSKRAFWGNTAFANDWQWLVGYPAMAIILWLIGAYYAEFSGRIEVTLATGVLGAFAAAVVAFLITWIASFIARFLNAPIMIYCEQKERADRLQKTIEEAQSTANVSLIDHARSFIFPPERERWKAEITFVRSGRANVLVEFSIFVSDIWSCPRRLPLRHGVDFDKGGTIPIDIMARDDSPHRFWRWATAFDERELVCQEMHQCRLVFIAEGGIEDYFNFVIESADDNDSGRLLIGENRFAFAQKGLGK